MIDNNTIQIAVCGAHMRELPLNVQLINLNAIYVRNTTTAPYYKLFALNGFVPPRPGLIRVAQGGYAIDCEIWQVPIENYGKFVASVPMPLGFGTIELADGSAVQGFLCEAYATQHALDISHFGGWRAYISANSED